MLMPKKVKYRKQQRGRRAGRAKGGEYIAFGDFARATANTAYGTCGVKVWMFHGEVLDKAAHSAPPAR